MILAFKIQLIDLDKQEKVIEYIHPATNTFKYLFPVPLVINENEKETTLLGGFTLEPVVAYKQRRVGPINAIDYPTEEQS